MSKRSQLIGAEHLHDHVLKLKFADGVELMADFATYFNTYATVGERRYGGPKLFKRFKIVGVHALEWGDMAVVFSAERLRSWRSTGVLPARSKQAA